MRCFHGIIGYKTFSTGIVTSRKLEKENVEFQEIYKRSFILKLKKSFFRHIFLSTLNWFNDLKWSSVTRKEVSGCTIVYCTSFKISSPLILWVCLPALKDLQTRVSFGDICASCKVLFKKLLCFHHVFFSWKQYP